MSSGGRPIRSQIHLAGITWLLLGLVTPVVVLALDPPVSSLQPSGSLGLLDNLVGDAIFAAVGVVLGMRGWTWWLSRLRAAQPAQEIAPRGRRLPSAFVALTCLIGVILLVVEIPFGVYGGAWVLVAIGTQWLFVAHRIGQLGGDDAQYLCLAPGTCGPLEAMESRPGAVGCRRLRLARASKHLGQPVLVYEDVISLPTASMRPAGAESGASGSVMPPQAVEDTFQTG